MNEWCSDDRGDNDESKKKLKVRLKMEGVREGDPHKQK